MGKIPVRAEKDILGKEIKQSKEELQRLFNGGI